MFAILSYARTGTCLLCSECRIASVPPTMHLIDKLFTYKKSTLIKFTIIHMVVGPLYKIQKIKNFISLKPFRKTSC